MATHSSSQAALERLSPAYRGLLLVKALMGGLCKNLTLDVLNAAVQPPKGPRWLKSDLLASEQGLRQLKLLNIQGRCPAKLEHTLACEAVADGKLVAALHKIIEHDEETAPGSLLDLALRVALYAGDEQAFAKAHRKAWVHYERMPASRSDENTPFADQGLELEASAALWYASRPLRMRLALLENQLDPLLQNGVVGPLLPAMLPDISRVGEVYKLEGLSPLVVLTEIFRGRAGAMEPVLAHWMGLRDCPHGHLAAGVSAMLHGEAAEALALLLEARKRWRKCTGKRNVLLPAPAAICLGMAQLASGDAAQASDLERTFSHILESWGLPHLPKGGWHALRALFLWNRGQEVAASESLDRALNAPSPAVVDKAVTAVADALINGKNAQARAAAVGAVFAELNPLLPLPCRILAEFLAVADPQAAEPHDALTRTQVTAGWLELFTPRAAWERLFDSVEHTLCNSQPKGSAASAAERRIVWALDLNYGSITPLEQKARGAGWTAGRPIALKRLSEERSTMPWLTEQDHRIISAITWSHRWHGITCDIDVEKALPDLVGHPLLVEQDTRDPLTLLRRDVTLSVREEKRGGYTLALSRPGGEAGRNTHVGAHLLVQEDARTWCLYHTEPRLRELGEQLGPKGLYVPPAGASRVLRLLRELDPAIPLRAEMSMATERPGNPRPVLRLSPLRGGLSISLGVRPFDGLAPDWFESPFFATGHGNLKPLADHLGHVYRVERDVDAEREAARALMEASPTLRELGSFGERDDFGPWELPDLEEALGFLVELRDLAGADPASGPQVEWPEGETLRVEPHVTAATLSVQIAHHREWFQMKGEMTVREGLVLDMGKLLERLELAKGRFIPLENGTFLALTEQFKRQLQRLTALSEAERDGSRKVHALGAAAVEAALDGVRAVSVDAAWASLMERIRAAESHEPRLPSTLRADLRDYQVEGFIWLSRLAHWGAGACLADDMGLGKTVQTIAALLEQAAHGPALIVAPTSVCHNWVNELNRFAPTLRSQRLAPGSARAGQIAALAAHDVLIISYGLLHTAAPALAARTWRTVVFDEAQALKNAATKRARASKTLTAHFRIALTGTPIENYLEDVWSLFNTINPGLLGTLKSFQQRFSSGSSEARKALRLLLRPFLLRRTKSAVLTELPPRTEQVVRVELPDEERAFYEALRRKALEQLEQPTEAGAGQRKLSILAELTRLRRACCHPALIDPETTLPGAKLAAFMDLTDNLIKGRHKALVFSQFVGHLALVRKALDAQRIAYQYLDGATPEHERQTRVRNFQDGEGDLFLISLKAGGQGLNLTAADYVIHLDPWWNPAVEDQASDRAHRMGQQRPVTVYRLVAAGSVEKKMLALHASKRSLAADILDGADSPLSETELLALFQEDASDDA